MMEEVLEGVLCFFIIFLVLFIIAMLIIDLGDKTSEELKELKRLEEEARKQREEEATKIKDRILLIFQLSPEEIFTSQQIQIKSKTEDFMVVILVLKMLKEEGEIKILTHPSMEELYTYNN